MSWLRRLWRWLTGAPTIRVPANLLDAPADPNGSRVRKVRGNKVIIETQGYLPAADVPVERVGGVWICTACLNAVSNCKCPK